MEHVHQEAVFSHPHGTFVVRLVFVTPDIAKEWLGENTHNRHITDANWKKIAEAIKRDEWQIDGTPIVRDTHGVLLNGQHRLLAVVEAGVGVWTFVIDGVSKVAQTTMDTGKNRKLADILSMPPNQEKNASTLAAAIAVIHRIRAGGMTRSGMGYPTHTQGLKILEDAPGLRESLSVGGRANSHLKVPSGLATALHYLFSEVDPEGADVFFDSLLTGEGLQPGDPILAARRNLERRAIKDRDRERMEVVGAWLVKAWNAWWEGKEVQRLYWTPGGPRPEPFPAIGGGVV